MTALAEVLTQPSKSYSGLLKVHSKRIKGGSSESPFSLGIVSSWGLVPV